MKKFFTVLLAIILTVSVFYVPGMANTKTSISTQTQNLRTLFSADLCETAIKENDGYLGVSVTFSVFRRKSVPDVNFCLLYVINHSEERIGTDSDEDIINDFLNQGYIVTVIDYNFNKKAVGSSLGYSIKEILADMRNGKYVGKNNFYKENIYVIPSGCRLERDVYYFSIDTMAPYGVNEYIIDTYNTYYAGVKKDNNGNLLPKATTLEECLNKDGTPIYLDLDMDIIYPANPKTTVPVFALASSSENRCAVVNRYNAQTVYFATALFTGYAGVVYNHEFMPMCRADHYGYDERFFTLGNYTANRSHSAAIRRIKYLADTYGYSSEYIINFGFSKSGLGPAIIADKTHEQRGEIKTLDDYCPEGKSVTDSPCKQPWLYYEGTNTPIDSNVTVVYAGAGAGVCNYVETCVNENVVPFAASIGTEDTIGGFNTFLPKTKSIFNSLNVENLFIEAEGIDHNPAHLYNETYEINYLDAVWNFLDNHIKAAYKQEAPKVLWSTPRSDILYESIEKSEISIKFSRAMNVESVISNTKVIRLSDGKEIPGTWTTLHGDTSFYFNSDYVINASTYRLEINENALAKDGVALTIPYSKSFTLDGDLLLSAQNDTYIANDSANHSSEEILSTANGNTAYLSFTKENGFSDVTKAKLLINRTTTDNAILDLSTLESGFNENTLTKENAPNIKNHIGSFAVASEVASIDITEYLSDVNGNTLSFALKGDSRTGEVYNKDFNLANASNFKVHNQFTWGNGDAVMNFSQNSYNSTNCLYITDRKWQTRLKFFNSLGKRKLTENDIGSVFKATFWIKSEESTSLLVGLFAESGTPGYVDYGGQNFNMTAGVWTFIEYITVITKEMVDVNACAVTLVPYGKAPFYLDDLTVVYDNSPCEFASSENTDGLSCSLLLYTPDKQEIELNDYSVIANGEFSNDSLEEVPNINGQPLANIDGVQKGYVKIPVENFDLSGSVTLDFSISALANNVLKVYGITDDDSRFAETFDGNINWNNAYANDTKGYSVLKDKIYGKKALASLDTSKSTTFSIDVKDYVTYMANLGYKAVTFIFCAEQQTVVNDITFENINSYNNYTASSEMKGYDIGLTSDPKNANNTVFYFDKSGKESGTNGYAQNIAFTGLIKSNDLFDESDIGTTYTISFKQYIELENYTTYAIYGNIGKAGSTNYSLPSYLKRQTLINGSAATPPANDWFTVEYTITVTEETVRDYANWTSIIVGSGWRATRIYVDDISVMKKADSIKIAIDNKTTEISNTNFETEDNFENYTPISQISGCEIGLKQDPKNATNTVMYFEKTGVESTGYYQALYLKNLIAKNGMFTDDDLGCVYTVRYKEYVEFTADSRDTYTIYDSISEASFRNFINRPSYLTAKFYYNGNEVTSSSVPTNDWFNVEMSFTVTADMIGTSSAPLGIMLASGWRASGIYIDDIIVSSSLPESEISMPTLTFNGTKESNYSTAAVIYGKTPNTCVKVGYSIDITNGTLKNPGGIKKLYTAFNKNQLYHTQKAFLNLEVTPESVGNTIYIYGIPKSIDVNKLTWNKAYANSEGLGISSALVYSNSYIACLTLSETISKIDITEFIKATDTLEDIILVICPKDGEGVTEFVNLNLEIQGFALYNNIEKPKLIIPDNITSNTFIALQTFNGIDVNVTDITFFMDSMPIDKMHIKNGETYYILPNNLPSGEHTLYATVTYNNGTNIVTDTLSYNKEDGIVLGDVNGDGSANAADLALLKKVLAELIPLDSEEVKYPDVDSSGGTPNAADLALLKKKIANLL